MTGHLFWCRHVQHSANPCTCGYVPEWPTTQVGQGCAWPIRPVEVDMPLLWDGDQA